MVMVRVAFAVPPALVAEIGTVNVPTLLTVPEITPLEEFMLKPVGRLVAQ